MTPGDIVFYIFKTKTPHEVGEVHFYAASTILLLMQE